LRDFAESCRSASIEKTRRERTGRSRLSRSMQKLSFLLFANAVLHDLQRVFRLEPVESFAEHDVHVQFSPRQKREKLGRMSFDNLPQRCHRCRFHLHHLPRTDSNQLQGRTQDGKPGCTFIITFGTGSEQPEMKGGFHTLRKSPITLTVSTMLTNAFGSCLRIMARRADSSYRVVTVMSITLSSPV